MDPLEEAEEILAGVEKELLVEQIKVHSEMILLTSIMGKSLIEGELLHKAQGQGPEYVTGTVLAVGLTAKNWGRVLGDDSTIDFTKYINPVAEAYCISNEDGFAHYLVREILNVETKPHADKVRKEIHKYLTESDAPTWARTMTHTIGLFGELVNAVIKIRNGDYTPGDSDDR